VASSILVTSRPANTQIQYAVGQNVVPVFEGWERVADGTFNMVFGYMNRNYEEQVDIPVGPENAFEPGVDRGQPTHFYNRRQQFVFKVNVPKDWGKKELVWTLTSHGRTEKAYATLVAFSEIDASVYQQNRGGPSDGAPNLPPSIQIVGAATRAARVAEPVPLAVEVSDDGHPAPRGRGAPPAAAGRGTPPPPVRRERPIEQAVVKLDPGVRLGVTWLWYRGGPGAPRFDPMRSAVENGRAETRVSLARAGPARQRSPNLTAAASTAAGASARTEPTRAAWPGCLSSSGSTRAPRCLARAAVVRPERGNRLDTGCASDRSRCP
jgi:hypothetical protein